MNYLQLVQESLKRAGIRNKEPTTLVGATDIVGDMADWVQDAWRELQEESLNWWFRAQLDQTLAISQSTDSYAMPSGLETLNWRTITIYTTAKTDETPVQYLNYEDWRVLKDTQETSEARPKYITERPDGVLQLWPVPDQAYTLRYDGVYDVDTMSADTDTPGFNATGAQTLNDRYHYVLVWSAVARYCEHYEDPEGLERAQKRYRAQHARLQERRIPDVWVPLGTLTGYNPGDRVGPRRVI